MVGFFVIWAAINFVVLFALVIASVDGANLSFVNPLVIYDNIDVNWFGAWLLSLIANIALPAVAIPYWFYKICTVGR